VTIASKASRPAEPKSMVTLTTVISPNFRCRDSV
jgi:hypothetical protein